MFVAPALETNTKAAPIITLNLNNRIIDTFPPRKNLSLRSIVVNGLESFNQLAFLFAIV
jgi:hypothetical protein